MTIAGPLFLSGAMAEVAKLLDEARRELLDLSARNRLLSGPLGSKSAKVIQADDESSNALYNLLVIEKRTVGFEARVESRKSGTKGAEEPSKLKNSELPSWESESEEENESLLEEAAMEGADSKATKRTKIKVGLTQEVLHRRLLSIFRDAQTMIEEQGVNIL